MEDCPGEGRLVLLSCGDVAKADSAGSSRLSYQPAGVPFTQSLPERVEGQSAAAPRGTYKFFLGDVLPDLLLDRQIGHCSPQLRLSFFEVPSASWPVPTVGRRIFSASGRTSARRSPRPCRPVAPFCPGAPALQSAAASVRSARA